MQKMVDGVIVQMTEQEIQARQEEEARNIQRAQEKLAAREAKRIEGEAVRQLIQTKLGITDDQFDSLCRTVFIEASRRG